MASTEARAQLARIGVRSLDPAAALATMERHLCGGPAQVAIANVDWARLREFYSLGRARTLLDDLAPGGGAEAAGEAPAACPLRAEYAHLSPPERREWLLAHLQRAVAEVWTATIRIPATLKTGDGREVRIFYPFTSTLLEIRLNREPSFGKKGNVFWFEELALAAQPSAT